jgi:hypothetical protein
MLEKAVSGPSAVLILTIGNPDMKQVRHFENVTRTATREATSIKTLIEDMRRVVGLLEDDFTVEKERSRIRGYSETERSILTKTLVARRDNLKATIATLETRL